jgi:hypothetical protein
VNTQYVQSYFGTIVERCFGELYSGSQVARISNVLVVLSFQYDDANTQVLGYAYAEKPRYRVYDTCNLRHYLGDQPHYCTNDWPNDWDAEHQPC